MELRLWRRRYADPDTGKCPLGQPAPLRCATIYKAAHDAGEKGEQRHPLGPATRAVEGPQYSFVQQLVPFQPRQQPGPQLRHTLQPQQIG